ncbi:DUF58 domain-containing protein [Halorussus halobius]|uniref:DUF58 domain-containing protein n=1 Tax=Halorussus halobius TaxID=1710537 RepID=UPI0010930275|nr:DUF58 domain-containing protein [Halorussus halobius]
MGVTRRYWGEAGLVVALAGSAALLARPLLLVGAAGLAGWLLARQYAFVRAVGEVAADLTVVQSPASEANRVDDEVSVALRVELAEPAPVALAVESRLPVGVEPAADAAPDDRRAVVPAGERTATTAFRVRCPVAGEFEFDPPTATATDATGRFRASFPAGETARLTVDPREPSDLHVGAGGEALDAAYGEHSSEARGAGSELADIRAYVPGDAVRTIDWNATARLGEPHVREFETDTRRGTALVLDRRASMAVGPPGGTAFEYARQFALGVVGHARERGEPVALSEVGAEGLLDRTPPTASPEGYARLERRLRALDPEGDGSEGVDSPRGARAGTPAVARERAVALRGESSAFADRLRPFFAAADPYVERATADPLYAGVRAATRESAGATTAVVVTDDANRAETREAATVAARHVDRVLAFLTPTALFADDADVEAAYDRYVDFERFRRDLASVEGVSAFEVGPGDRLARLLADARDRAAAGGSRAGERRVGGRPGG